MSKCVRVLEDINVKSGRFLCFCMTILSPVNQIDNPANKIAYLLPLNIKCGCFLPFMCIGGNGNL